METSSTLTLVPSRSNLPKPPEPAKLSVTHSRLRRRMSLLQYRRRRNSVKEAGGKSASESLSEQLRSTSLSDGPSKKRVKSEDNALSSTTASPNEVGLDVKDKNNYGFPELPFKPEFHAGILILVTSPKGDVSLGVCDDGDNVGRSSSVKKRARPARRLKEEP
ncbi:hypothetical protein AJ79_06893 [Helicocarpus griseus UAMH5409]|uniref:Uncharacterized protein n=1 Tax=Helicocarpus griseus UAMH5409 TaxID=1447875 RepID=A0A2B7X8G5_9EURO|nr:hypothetical protein AJ79_06893 [Helicocarpus griseus UAMH5409]